MPKPLDTLLSVRDLKVCLGGENTIATIIDGLSFDIRRGETLAILGESGCGKSMTALSIMGLLPAMGQSIAGSVFLDGEDLMQLSASKMRRRRGSRIAMIFQEPMTSLNPVLTVARQIGESLALHKNLRGAAARQRTIELLASVGIPAPEKRIDEYPHQLSGGMKQRVMIAIALAGEPDLLIADEPTTALDVTTQAQVLQLLRDLQQQTGMAVLLITHDLGVVAEMADQVAVMYAGQLVEQAGRAGFFSAPQHPYSLKLFSSLPSMQKRDQLLEVIKGSVPPLTQHFVGCRFESRCEFSRSFCREQAPEWSTFSPVHQLRCHRADPDLLSDWFEYKPSELAHSVVREHHADVSPLLEVNNLKVHFPVQQGVLAGKRGYVYAVDGIDLTIRRGKTLALVGESGCGKSTVGKAILQLQTLTAGQVLFEGCDLASLKGEALRQQRRDFQIIFQDPFSSMNPRVRVGDIIAEGMAAQNIGVNKEQRRVFVDTLLESVGLSAAMRDRYPHEFSGGQRQRICIARALALQPKLIVCDEPTSALDVSVQAQILNLLQELQTERGLSYLFITHNLSVVAYLAHEVAVMYLGRIVERGTVAEVLECPRHPYTQALLSAVPVIDDNVGQAAVQLEGDMPSPIEPPLGCHFHPRCAEVQAACYQQSPKLVSISGTHSVACLLCF